MIRHLVVILGDQLSPRLSALEGFDPAQDVIVMMEVMAEAMTVPHHPQKIAFILSAMRHFAQEQRARGWPVDYVHLEDPANTQSFSSEVARAIARHKPQGLIATWPGEWDVWAMMQAWGQAEGVPLTLREDTRFIADRAGFAQWAKGRKQLRMEYFYRLMRKKTGLLMDGDAPAGGQWNYDADNRKGPPKGLRPPPRLTFAPDDETRHVLDMVARHFGHHFGRLEPFHWAVTRADAERARDYFMAQGLAHFGDYQDAMMTNEPTLFHSVLSPYLNVGLLDPMDLCRRAEAEYRAGRAAIHAVEGFIRQIVGWREYVRGIYWAFMPEYRDRNALGHNRPLPDFYWTGETDLHCLAQAIGQTRDHAYAHHIQRLMVTGNFALLAGCDPRAVHEWYLTVYADAFEWVELPNTLGMAMHADGGLMASKPYVASGKYIARMSDYCKSCRYDPNQSTGETACPFNALYWHFMMRHRARLGGNPRLAMAYRTLDKMKGDHQAALHAQAENFLTRLFPLHRR